MKNKKLLIDVIAIIILTALGIILVKTQMLPGLGGFFRWPIRQAQGHIELIEIWKQ